MADKTTFVKIDRNIIEWRWFKDSKVLHVFLWLLIKANIKEGHFKRDEIKRGSLATSNAHIAEGCGLTIDSVRTALAALEETGEITRESRNHYQIISIVNYESYQSDITKTRYQVPGNTDSKSQASPRQIPTIKEYKNKRMERKKEGSLRSDSPSGTKTLDDIPEMYRDMGFQTYDEYLAWRNQ